MKKKTLAAASLLLALLMPLGATPLAAYAEEFPPMDGNRTAAVEQATRETALDDTAETNKIFEDEHESDNAYSAENGQNADADPSASDVTTFEVRDVANPVAAYAATTLNAGPIHVTNSSENFDETYDNLGDAVKNAPSGSTIELGAGSYSLYTYSANPDNLRDSSKNPSNPEWKNYIVGKSLTFVGQSTDDTFWNIGTPYYDASGETNGDYSFDGADVITFKNLTLQSPVQYDGTIALPKNYTGFIRPNKTIVEDCVIKGRTAYWGYDSAEFKSTTFICASGDYEYAIWTYSSSEMTFDNCTFDASANPSYGKIINVYTDYIPETMPSRTFTINYKDCTVISPSAVKQVLNINDSRPEGQHYVINISGNNVIKGSVPADSITCSRLFGFAGKSGNNAGNTTVNIEGTTVWSNGRRAVDHNGTTFSSGTYDNGNGKGNTNQYTDGYKDDAFTTTYGSWEWNQTENKLTRDVTKTCNYCGDKETTHETKELELDVSRSKTATALDGNDHSTVTLSLPSAEEKLASDVVFVLDTSDCYGDVMPKISELVAQLKTAQEKNQAGIKVGAVIFNGSAYTMFDGKLVDAATAIESLNKLSQLKSEEEVWKYLGLDNDTNYVNKGSNLHAGLRAAQKLLESDNTVAAERKYLVSITDGMTYYWNDEQDNVYGVYSYATDKQNLLFYAWCQVHNIDQTKDYALPSGFNWAEYLTSAKGQMDADKGQYRVNVRAAAAKLGKNYGDVRFPYMTAAELANVGIPAIPDNESSSHAHGIDYSVMACLDTYQEMVNAGYQCYTLNPRPNYNTRTFPGLFTSKLNEMANKDVIDFDSIQNDILYAVGAGSVVEDKMGADFDFVPGSLVLTVGGTPLDSKTEGNATYFGAQDTTKEIASDNCRFKVEYDSSEDKFTWTINENVSNFAPVQLSYQVKLVNRSTTAGSYTVPTNEYAKLTPKDSNGKIGTALDFNVPTASYTIYVLNYDANGGSGAPDGEIKRTDKFTVSNTAPTRNGYNFVGWNTAADGSGTDYPAGSEITLTKESPALTLYAKWTEVVPATPSPTPSATPSATPAPTAAPTAAPTSTPAPTVTATAAKTAAIPQTSDAFPIEALLALLAIGAAGFGAAGYLRKKHH